MRISGDYHLHTVFSDGRASIAERVFEAEKKGLQSIAITDHSFKSLTYNMTDKKFFRQCEEISAINSDVKVYHGVEGNLLPSGLDVPLETIKKCDILLLGFHRYIKPDELRKDKKFFLTNGFAGSVAKERMTEVNTSAYINAMKRYPVDVLVHLGHRAMADYVKIFSAAKESGVYVELNEKHVETLEGCIDLALDMGVEFILGSDGHRKNATGSFERVEEFIRKHKIPPYSICGIDGKEPKIRNKEDFNGDDV